MLMFIFSVDINILLVPCNSHHSIYNDPSAKTQGTEGAPPSAASCWTEDWNQVPWKYLHTGIIFTPGNIYTGNNIYPDTGIIFTPGKIFTWPRARPRRLQGWPPGVSPEQEVT